MWYHAYVEPDPQPFAVGDLVRLSHTGYLVTVDELIGTTKARVRWQTAGRKPRGRRYFTVSPQSREKVVRLTSLERW